MKVRKPAAAGQFYPGRGKDLHSTIGKMVVNTPQKKHVKGIVSPHAGYIYSGPTAGKVFSAIEVPDVVIIIGPNHRGIGKPYAIMDEGIWETPLGKVEIDSTLAKKIIKGTQLVEVDPTAHIYEHSLEVQVPFLQYCNPDIKIVPLAVSGFDLRDFREIAKAIASSIKSCKKEILIVASSDMTHYESQESTKKKDSMVIDNILKLDEEEMLNIIRTEDVSMCGYAPVAIMLAAAKSLGASKAELIDYSTSGDTSGDFSSVVGYAGLIVY